MLQREIDNDGVLKTAAKSLLQTKASRVEFANDVLDALVGVDDGEKVYWNNFDADREVRKAFRVFLGALGLKQVEKKTLKNGIIVHMAFVKSYDSEAQSILTNARTALEFALRAQINEQVAQLRVELAARADASETPMVVTGEPINFDDDKLPPVELKSSGSGLLTLETYKELREAGALNEMSKPTLQAEPPAPDIFAKTTRDHAAIAKFNKAQRLQNELWGLSASRQSKLRRHLGDE